MLTNLASKSILHKNPIKIIFETVKNKFFAYGNQGDTVLQVARKNKIDLEGACEGSLACSTCHVILQKDIYDKLGEPSEKEDDLLDQAYGLTSTSRLGCQIRISPTLKNCVIRIPIATRNIAVDGYKPKPH